MVQTFMRETWPTAIAIGGSAGSIETLGILLPAVAGSTTLPILVVLHLPSHEPTALPDVFAAKCAVPIRVPFDKEPCAGGLVWFAPPGFHLLVERNKTFSLSLDEPVSFSRPSLDVLFESAADAYGPDLVVIVLSGASRDGAAGAARVRECGGFVVVQDPSTTAYCVMPNAAIAEADPQIVTDRTAIAALIAEITLGPR